MFLQCMLVSPSYKENPNEDIFTNQRKNILEIRNGNALEAV